MEAVFCTSCRKLPLEALRCSCGSIYCASCYTNLKRVCKLCSSANTASAYHEIRSKVAKCLNCPSAVLLDSKSQELHLEICPGFEVRCLACSLRRPRSEMNTHLFTSHYFQLLESYADPIIKLSKNN